MLDRQKTVDDLKADFYSTKDALLTALKGKASYSSYTDSLEVTQSALDRSFSQGMHTFVSASSDGYKAFAYNAAKEEITSYKDCAEAYLLCLPVGTIEYEQFLQVIQKVLVWDRPVIDLEVLKDKIRRATNAQAPEKDRPVIPTEVASHRQVVLDRMHAHKMQ